MERLKIRDESLPCCLHLRLLLLLQLTMSCCSLALQQGASQLQKAARREEEDMRTPSLTQMHSCWNPCIVICLCGGSIVQCGSKETAALFQGVIKPPAVRLHLCR